MQISEAQELAKKFVDERGWRPFQTTKEIAIDVSVEAGELLELFLWDKEDNLENKIRGKSEKELLQKIKNETSDVFLGCLSLADQAGFDLEEAFIGKLHELEKRYDKNKVFGDPSKKPSKN